MALMTFMDNLVNFLNDSSDVCKCSLPILSADDANLFYHVSDFSVVENAVNKKLADIAKWLNVDRLPSNIKNTHYMILSRNKSNHLLDLLIDNK